MKVLIFNVLLILLVSCGGGGGDGSDNPPPINQPQPTQFGTDATFVGPSWTGAYNVASTQYYWEDVTREEPHTGLDTDNRELIIRVFYPTDANYTDNRLAVIDNINWQSFATFEAITNSRLRQSNYSTARWNVEIDAPISTGQASYPLLIFSHGYGLNPEDFVSTVAELASRGYIVATINHPYGSRIAAFPDGRNIATTGLPDNNLGEDLMLWSEDQSFVLDQLDLKNQTPADLFFSKINMQQIGTFGHSYGGATAYYSLWRDSRFMAGINMDGTIFNSENKFSSSPFMYILAGSGSDLTIFDQVNNDGYAILFDGQITHSSFADFSLHWAWDFPTGRPFGPLDPSVMLETNVEVIAQYFDKSLLSGNAPILDDADQTPSIIRVVTF